MLWTGILVGLAIGAVIGVPAMYWEVKRQTRRARAAERRARDSQRLAEIGAMTGGLAHEIKNPLSTIGLNAQLLAEGLRDAAVDPKDRDRLLRRIDVLRREVERLRDTLGDFLRYAGALKLEPRRVNLNSVVEELVDFYVPQAEHHGIRMRCELSPDPLWVEVDVGHFKQAVLNLLINATQAMEGGSSEAGPAAPGRPKELILRTTSAKGDAGPVVELHVIDTGPGIPPDHIERIFTPYFTTKSGGSGLGLPTARRIIEGHHGQLDVVSEPQRGTDFIVRLPRAS